MAYSDWAKFGIAGSEVTVYPASPPEGTGHLYVQCPQGGVFFYPTAPSYSKGVTDGRYRTLVRLDNSTANSTSGLAGIVVMASATTIATVSGNFYWICQCGGQLQIRRGNTTTLGSGGTLLVQQANVVTTGVPFSLQVDWSVEASSVDFIVYTGANIDFSDLASFLTYSDTSASRLTSSVIEGLGVARSGSGVNALVSWDLTSLGTPS